MLVFFDPYFPVQRHNQRKYLNLDFFRFRFRFATLFTVGADK